MKKIRLHCPCGEMIVADSEDELVEKANDHLNREHPDLAGTYTREQILTLAF
jgi:predicted small metal-binding protein